MRHMRRQSEGSALVVWLATLGLGACGFSSAHNSQLPDGPAPATVEFANATTMVDVVLDTSSELPITVDYALSGTASGGGTDYTLAAGTVTFPAHSTTQPLSLGVVQDMLDEDDETIILTLGNPTNVIIGATASH